MSTDGTHPDIPNKDWTNPFPEQHPFHDLYESRISQQQDLVILIDDYHSRRGTGKSVASLQLAEGMNQTGNLTYDNVTLDPSELRKAYSSLPERSALVFDEGELGASNRDAMTSTNKALREIMSIGRVEEKYVIVNTPDINFIDKDIQKLADVWMTMLTKGVALIHYLKRNPYGSGSQTLTEANGIIEFNDIQKGSKLRQVYNKATREKRKHIDGEGDQGRYIPQKKHKKKLKQVEKKARKEERDKIITKVYNRLGDLAEEDYTRMKRGGGVSQAMLGEAVDLTQQQIGNIVRG